MRLMRIGMPALAVAGRPLAPPAWPGRRGAFAFPAAFAGGTRRRSARSRRRGGCRRSRRRRAPGGRSDFRHVQAAVGADDHAAIGAQCAHLIDIQRIGAS